MLDQILTPHKDTLSCDKQNELLSILNNSVKSFSKENSEERKEKSDFSLTSSIYEDIGKKTNIASFLPKFHKPAKREGYFTQTNTWICHVIAIDNQNNTFEAKLEDLNSPTTYEEAEFDINEIPNEDLELLTVGSIFYWSIGYEHRSSQISKSSIIRFKRALNVTDVDHAIDWADNVNHELKWS